MELSHFALVTTERFCPCIDVRLPGVAIRSCLRHKKFKPLKINFLAYFL